MRWISLGPWLETTSATADRRTGVSLLLNEILKARPNLRIFLLDVHNEYGRCFGDRSLVRQFAVQTALDFLRRRLPTGAA